jgi:hypothetical protein
MKRYRFEAILGASFVALYLVFSAWHSQGSGKLTQPEIDHYMALIERLAVTDDGKDIASRIRSWAEADDGKPFYMFNLIHFFPKVRTFAGAPDFKGTPEEANDHYEKSILPLWLRHASYPTFSGSPQSRNLINMQPERTWGEVAVVRYPTRRTFLKLVSDPAYAPLEPYKFIALELDLVPVSPNIVIPDLRWIVGGGLVLTFLLIGWIRAGRRHD